MARPIRIFSLIYNFRRRVQGKKVENIDKAVHQIHYDKQPKFIKQKCTDLCSYLNSAHFSYNDLKLFLYYRHLFGEKVDIGSVQYKDIMESLKLFKKDQYQKDQKFILTLSKKQKIKDVKVFFDINENGRSFIFDLVINKYVSPMFYIRMRKYIPQECEGETDEHRHFRELLEQMMVIMKVSRKEP